MLSPTRFAASTQRTLLITHNNLPSCARTIPTAFQQQQQQQQNATQQKRSKHSKTQKRRFQNHPATKRAQSRLRLQQIMESHGVEEAEAREILKKKKEEKDQMKKNPPKYPPVFEYNFLPNGWSKPPDEGFVLPDYPFHVTRTGNKPNGAAGFLPVYSDIRANGTKKTTLIRRVTGDQKAFLQELQAVLHQNTEKGLGSKKDLNIRIRAGGNIELNGSRVKEVKNWLAGLGF